MMPPDRPAPAAAAADGPVPLAPRFFPGDTFRTSWRMRFDADRIESDVVALDTQLFRDVVGEATVSTAEGTGVGTDRPPRVTVRFGRCRAVEPAEQGGRGGPQKTRPLFIADRAVVSAVAADPFTGEPRMAVTEDGRKVPPLLEAVAGAVTGSTVMPEQPIAVGHAWTAGETWPLFGPGSAGELKLRYARRTETALGPAAVVEATGESTIGMSTLGGFGALSARLEKGEILIDLATGRIVEARFEGPASVNDAGLALIGKVVFEWKLGTFEDDAEQAEAHKTVRDKAGHFSLRVPADWVTSVNDLGVWIFPAHRTLRDPQQASRVSIARLKDVPPTELKTFFDMMVTGMGQQEGYTVEEHRAMEVGGRPGYGCVFAEKQTGLKARRGLMLVTMADGQPVTFRASIREDVFPLIQDELKAVRASFKVYDPPQPDPVDGEDAGPAGDRRDPAGRAAEDPDAGRRLADW